jgi:hypothetical protein
MDHRDPHTISYIWICGLQSVLINQPVIPLLTRVLKATEASISAFVRMDEDHMLEQGEVIPREAIRDACCKIAEDLYHYERRGEVVAFMERHILCRLQDKHLEMKNHRFCQRDTAYQETCRLRYDVRDSRETDFVEGLEEKEMEQIRLGSEY